MSQYSNADIRNLMTSVFADEEEFDFFIEDHFSEVAAQFEAGMSFKRKAQTLAQYCQDRNLVNQLMALIAADFPAQFAASGLPKPDSDAPAVTETAPPQPATAGAEPAAKPAGQDVFISYSRKDEAFIKQLYQELTGRGISAWYDRENIGVATHWPSQIVEGIRDCKVFVLAVSPDSTASVNVRKEVDLAQRYQKQIVPLIWRPTQIPVAMEYQLAGIQWIEFNELATPDKFNQLAEVLQGLVGGASLSEASSGKQIVTESKVPAPVPEAAPVPAGGLVLDLRKKKTVSPIGLGGSVIASVVTQFGLPVEQQNLVNAELKWLFGAADNFLKIRKNELARSQAISIKIPPTAQPPQGSNRLLDSLDDFDLQIWEGQLESMLTRIRTHLRNLDILIERQANMGDAGKGDVYLQNQIKGSRLDIVKILQEMAQLLNQAYGIRVTSPDQLVEFLEQ